MDIKNKEALIAEIEQFKEEALKMHIVQVLADTYERSSLFDHNINADGSVIWFKTQARQLWDFWQAAKAQAVPEGFVEKTESNTHHYFKLKDWDEWTCIDGIKDAITSDHDINAIVEVECLEVIEINNKPCFALLAFGKRHGTEVKFFDTEEEAIEAQEQK